VPASAATTQGERFHVRLRRRVPLV
jgi:hypothetical protein